MVDNILLMLGFEPWISVVRSDRSTKYATTPAQIKPSFQQGISTFVVVINCGFRNY